MRLSDENLRGQTVIGADGQAVEIPIRLIQSVGDAVVLSVPVDGLRQVRPEENEPAAVH